MAIQADKATRRPVWLPQTVTPAIMESIDNPILIYNENYIDRSEGHNKKGLPSLPDVTLTSQFTSLMLGSADKNDNIIRSFLLIDGKENFKVCSSEDFVLKLGIDADNTRVKVVSIFGNTGDGKSHTLNHLFFGGNEVFPISPDQTSCTVGVWAAYDSNSSIISIDTEGLLGSTLEEARRTRLLLKVLAISDVVIFRTRSERIHRDLFSFLGSASRAYMGHFQTALESVNNRSNAVVRANLGPAVIISHETRNTKPLTTSGYKSPEDMLRDRFHQLGLEIDSFSSITYVGQQTVESPTQYGALRKAVMSDIANTCVRSARSPKIVYFTLKTLNDKFCGNIKQSVEIFPDEYFTCSASCMSCGSRCQSSMGHEGSSDHRSPSKCRYTHQYENIIYICKTCYRNGNEVIVKPQACTSNDSSWFGLAKYAWSGYVIECPNCGEIYRSRQFWYGNSPPELSAVRTEIHHVWPGMSCSGASCQNSAQRVLDSVSALTEVVAQVSATPTKVIGSWVADQIAPKYWKPNPQVKMCSVCTTMFTSEMTKHHCRACGEGVCANCSNQTKPVPEKGWCYPVRVCDHCARPPRGKDSQNSNNQPWVVAHYPDRMLVVTDDEASQVSHKENQTASPVDENEVIARKVSEAVVTTISSVASILEYPKSVIKETARPSYWTPDSEARECCVCSALFTSVGGKAELHHCRNCGGAVCLSCSPRRRPVPHRGWHAPVRVCSKCDK